MSINPSNTDNTTGNFIAALVTNASLLAVEVGAFLILKQRLWRIYTPRAYLPPPDKRAAELPSGPWRWLPALLSSPNEDIIHKNGLDAYMFLRFLKLLIRVFLAFTLLTFAVIIPADSAGIITSHDGLERITWTNIVRPQDEVRFSAHITVVYILTFFVIYMIRREMIHFVHMRHQFLLSKSHSRLAQARTVLITSVPNELANEHDLRTFASFVPGGVDRVWLYRDTKDLNHLFEQRQDTCKKLEAATSKILKKATKAWRRKEKLFAKERKRMGKDVEKDDEESNKPVLPTISKELLDELVPSEIRPKHRVGFLGLVGSKVDTIEWCKEDISRLNAEIKTMREHLAKGKFLGSAFIRCNLQIGAHVLAQCISYHEPLMMYDRWMEAHPKDIVWKNLDDGALEMRSRYVISWLGTAGLIVAWAFPVGFIGTLSNVKALCIKVHWLFWLCKVSPTVSSIIQGVLPPLLLALLFLLLPFILRALAWYECIPRYSLISVSVYRRFYFFLLIHGFLIVTLTSGITKAIEDIIQRPTETVSQLAKQLPGASVFFLTYMVTQGLAGAGGALAQLAPLILYYIRKWFLGRTPRQAYSVTFLMPNTDFGIVLPRLSLLATISFAYSVLAPLINFLALISFVMFYLAWKFLLTQVFDQPDEMETGGMYFPMAINNLFVGLYIQQICMACLFLLNITTSRTSSIVEGALMFVLLVITACAQIFFNHSYHPITQYLPMSLATKKMAKRYEKQGATGTNDGIDLFSRNRIRSVRKRIKATTKKLDDRFDILKIKVTGKNDKHEKAEEYGRGSASQVTVAEPSGGSGIHPNEDHQDLQRTETKESQKSKASKASKRSDKPEIPLFDPAAPAVIADESDEEDDPDEHAFDHPSTYVDQACIWIPKDRLGLSEMYVNEFSAAGVDASDVGAVMDKKGVVEVTRNPPDEEWAGGHDR